ncbi:protoporphyrinogen oxidase [Agrococcus sp. Ld7]|uniref:protoporphyrinogen oxidase n=1 Tax=Agrococcus sp. Ld7 TaxID=649148 RepID=UPI0038684565
MTGSQTDAQTSEEPARVDTIVVGAGIAGLTIAHDLAARGYRVLVLEAADRVGGTVARLELPDADLVLDAGAESFAVRGGAVAELADELGLGAEIVDPNPAGAWLQLTDRAVPMPKRTLLGIPSTPLAQDVIDALGWGGALRAYLDRLMPVLRIGTDDALGPLVRRRMGQKVLDRLVAPLAGGVYSADPERLDVAVVAPGLNGGITRAGSLSGGVAFVLEERAQAAGGADTKPGSAVQGIRGGVHQLSERLAARAREHRADIRTGVRVLRVSETDAGWSVATDAGTHESSSLVVALPEHEARQLLLPLAAPPVDELPPVEELPSVEERAAQPRASASSVEERAAQEHASAPSVEERAAQPRASRDRSAPPLEQLASGDHDVTVELVTLVFPPGAIQGDPRGTGVLVAGDNEKVRAKAMTHSTAKWAWLRDAAGGREIVRLSYGSGAAAPATEGLDDDAAAALALADAQAIFGTSLPQPVASARVRWRRGQPSSIVGARARQQELRDVAAARANLFVIGGAVAGTGLAQVVPDARRTALEIRREQFAVHGSPWTDDILPEEHDEHGGHGESGGHEVETDETSETGSQDASAIPDTPAPRGEA